MADYKAQYESKLLSVTDAAKLIENNDNIFMSPCCGSPIQLVQAIEVRWEELHNINIISGQLLFPFEFVKDSKYREHLHYITLFYGLNERVFYDRGNITINSCQFSELKKCVEDVCKVNAYIADVSPMDEDGYFNVGPMGVCIGPAALDISKKVIVQVNKYQPEIKGEAQWTKIHISQVSAICEADHELPEFPNPPAGNIDQQIAKLLLPYVTDGCTLQIGIGGLANAVGYGLFEKKNLSIYTEMFSDSMMDLMEAGAISGEVNACLGLGSKKLFAYCGTHNIEFKPFYEMLNIHKLLAVRDLVCINACLMATVTGETSSESTAYYPISSVGGGLDFVRAAHMNPTAKSFLCVPSTREIKGRVISNIVVDLPAGQAVTVPRSDNMYIVTEYGIADIWNQPIPERVKRMIAIAHPDFREQLTTEAKEAGLFFPDEP